MRVGVEGAGGFVREEEGRVGDQRPGHGGALVLTAGQGGGALGGGGDLQLGQQSAGPFVGVVRVESRQQSGEDHVLRRGEFREELPGLEHHSDVPAAHGGQPAPSHPGDLVAEYAHTPGIRSAQTQDAGEQRALARTAGAGDHGRRSPLRFQVHSVKQAATTHRVAQLSQAQRYRPLCRVRCGRGRGGHGSPPGEKEAATGWHVPAALISAKDTYRETETGVLHRGQR